MPIPVIMPRQGQSVESCILVEWHVAPGDKVDQGAILASIETDKAAFEIEAPDAGTVLTLFFEAGDDVPVLTNIAALGEPGEDAEALRPGGESSAPAPAGDTPAPVQGTKPTPAPADVAPVQGGEVSGEAGGGVGVSPRARGLAQRTGVSAESLTGTGPGGRVIERDVQRAADEGPRLSPAARAAVQAGGAAVPAGGSGPAGMVLERDLQAATAPVAEHGTEIMVEGIRKIVADRMHASLAGTAQLTLNRSFDATAVLALRGQVKAHGERLGLPNITINDIVAFATARLLARNPEVNAHWLGDRIVQHGQVNLGVAMDTPRGLMVPVVRDAGRMSLSEISRAIKPMVDAAREGGINPDLLQGGTFTITNLGTLGIESFTPILNAPEVAILGVGGLFLKPVPDGDGVKHVQAMNLSLTIDHQAVDGAPGARFLAELAESLENIDLVLAG